MEYDADELAKIMVNKLDNLDFEGQDFVVEGVEMVAITRKQFEEMMRVIKDTTKEYLEQEKVIKK